jgi:hypothetical protein
MSVVFCPGEMEKEIFPALTPTTYKLRNPLSQNLKGTIIVKFLS